MKKLLTILLSAIAVTSFADTSYEPVAYLNINSGISTLSSLPTGEWNTSINGGYDFNRYIAIEGGYSLFTGSQYGGVSTNTNIVDVAGKGTLPFSSWFALYGRLGLGYGFNSFSGTPNTVNNPLNSGTANFPLLLSGVGANFTVAKHVDLRIEDTFYTPFVGTYTGNINAVTGGVQFNF